MAWWLSGSVAQWLSGFVAWRLRGLAASWLRGFVVIDTTIGIVGIYTAIDIKGRSGLASFKVGESRRRCVL